MAIKSVKRTPAYRQMHGRLISAHASDQWGDVGHVFVSFDLSPLPASDTGENVGALALFVVSEVDASVVSVKILTPRLDGEHIQVEDLVSGGRSLIVR